jgi:hypothetical protein
MTSCRSPANLNQKQPMFTLDSVTPVRRGWASDSEVIPSMDKEHCHRQRSERVLSTIHPTINLCAEAIPRFHGCYNGGNHNLLPRSARDDQQRGSVSETQLEEGLRHVGRSSSCRADRLYWRCSQVQFGLSPSPTEPRIAWRNSHTW